MERAELRWSSRGNRGCPRYVITRNPANPSLKSRYPFSLSGQGHVNHKSLKMHMRYRVSVVKNFAIAYAPD